MRFYRPFSFIIALVLLVACEPSPVFYPLRIESKNGTQNFQVELADSDIERERGLMFREKLDADHGMLFIFDAEAQRAFWMKNTRVGLDILFIRADGTVAHIAKNAKPHDETPIPSNEPALAVLEILAGEADKRGIKVNDRIVTELMKQESVK